MKVDNLLEKVISFCSQNDSEIFNLIKEICLIPAPSGKEEKRAEFVKNYLTNNGATNVYIDNALNVVYPVNDNGNNNLILFLAHTDTVFPDETPMPYYDDGEYIYSPGVTDNVVCLAQMLTVCKFIANNKLLPSNVGVLFVANSCEEGLGNLKGVRQIFETYKNRIITAYSFDGQYDALVTRAVGSNRYKITVKTEGGHSLNAFGNKSAILVTANLISKLYSVEVPIINDSKTTYNVGVISGGTSVNTIAESCEVYYEYRSNNAKCLKIMEQNFISVINDVKLERGVEIYYELVGNRPCGENINLQNMNKIIDTAVNITQKYSGVKCNLTSGSTDCNIPLSLGVPAVCVGTHIGYGAHTREEKLLKSSVNKGLKIVAETIINYFK